MKKQGIKILSLIKSVWNKQTLIFLSIITLVFAVFVLLSGIPGRASVEEQATAKSSSSISKIIERPVNAPYKIATFVTTAYSPSVKMVRAVSFVFYLGACVAMFYALRHWHTLQTSMITTAAFATNSVVLATSRLGTPLITLMSFFIFTSLILWQLHSRSNKFVPLAVLLAAACLLYSPGALWFMLILGIIYWRRIKKPFLNVKKQAVVVGLVVSAGLLAPLIISFINDSSSLREWLLLPERLDWANIPRSILRVPSALIYRMPEEPLINVGRLPIFDVSAGILFLIGLNAYRKKLSLDRTKVMLVSALFGVIIGAFGELLYAVIFLLPFAYSVIAAGIEFLLDEWYSVFPKNPFARSFGLILITSVTLFSIYYQTTRYFVVWPQTPETRSVYNQSRIIND